MRFRTYKGLAAGLLLSLVVFQGIAWLVAWQWMCVQTQRDAWQMQADEVEPTRMRVARKDLPFQMAGKREIRINGQLYDIRSYQVDACTDSIVLWLYHDSKEQELLTTLDHFFAGGQASSQAPAGGQVGWLAQWLCMAYLAPQSPLPVQLIPYCDSGNFIWLFPESFRYPSPPDSPPWARC